MARQEKKERGGGGGEGDHQPSIGSRANNVHSCVGAEGNLSDYSEGGTEL